ncbi:MAG: hypothetical protein DWQ34_23365 [Planctomycetota bacterium]|nr:MAG: hypothetical protein DWQ29_13970 [Planctomycetota bacterium]REJ88068.1 MAG: hypothetical protein DWQ34_23365 [Planctomycetota bacterium]REK24186.1 MAG: hypothetical protein DWQ41_14185 [Planctomycetota bacterium]REK28827.1 MAG: hypothetical protein DWQ45_24330 [Planctomycetota bacterium]
MQPEVRRETRTSGTGSQDRLEVTEFLLAAPASMEIEEFDAEGRLPPFPNPLRHPLRAIAWIVRCLFGLASLILMLAVISAIPIVNFLALGYLLEVEGRVGRTGKLRNAFPLLGIAPRIGSIALGVWLWLLPLRFLSSLTADASLINPGGGAAVFLRFLTPVAWAGITLHLCLALARGGSLGCFFRPLKNVLWLVGKLREGAYLETASRHIRDFLSRLKLKHHFMLGLRGFLGAFLWLIVPTLFYAAARQSEGPQILATVFGGFLLVIAFAWVPFLQAHFAAQNRFGAYRELGTVRELFRHAPFAWLIAVIVVYVLALPLYLFKIVLPPADAMWGVTLVFIVSIYPARVVTGWAYGRAVRRQREGLRSWFVTRFFVRLLMLPLIAAFVFLMFFTQFIGEEGKLELFQHHAFLLPWPMFLTQ